jgi:hypothetical protein
MFLMMLFKHSLYEICVYRKKHLTALKVCQVQNLSSAMKLIKIRSVVVRGNRNANTIENSENTEVVKYL